MKWFKRILLGILALVLLAVGTLYAWSAVIIGKEHPVTARSVTLSSAPEVVAEGERLARVLVCFNGCHGKDMEGILFFEQPLVGRFVAPNLTTLDKRYTPEETEALVRQGVRPDGKSLFGMPSDSFSIMTDEHLTAVLSFIDSYPAHENDPGKTSIGPLGRLGLVLGQYFPAAVRAQSQPWLSTFIEDPLRHGEYLAITACAECHGPDLDGSNGFAPPLTIAKAYSFEDFSKLMATGEGLGGRDLGLMSRMTQTRFQHMTDDEVEHLHAYLNSR